MEPDRPGAPGKSSDASGGEPTYFPAMSPICSPRAHLTAVSATLSSNAERRSDAPND